MTGGWSASLALLRHSGRRRPAWAAALWNDALTPPPPPPRPPRPDPGPPPDEWDWMDTDPRRLASTLDAEARYADAVLSPLLPNARALAARAAAWFPADECTVPEALGAWRYWTEQRAGDAGPRLLRVPAGAPQSATPSLVLDAAAVLDDLGAVGGLTGVALSPCGQWVAAVADCDSEPAVTVRAVGGGARGELRRIRGALGAEWGAGGDLFYTACPAGDGRASEVRVAAGVAGSSGGPPTTLPDPLLLAWPDPRSHLALGRTKDGAWLVATAARRDAATPHVLRLGGGGGGGGGGPASSAFTRVGGRDADDAETYVEGDGRGGLIVLTNEAGAGQGGDAAPPQEAWVAAAPGPGTPPAAWSCIVPRRAGVAITDVDVYAGPMRETADAILLYERHTQCGRPGLSLARLAWAAGGGGVVASPPASVRLPPPDGGAWAVIRPGANADPAARTARVLGSSPLSFPTAWDVCLLTGAVSRPATPAATRDAAAAVAAAAAGTRLRRTTVASPSAPAARVPPVRVPLTVLEPREKRASAAALLVVYGAYGLPLDPDFDPLWLTLALEGWSVILAGVRGGGEGGRAWHAAGRGEHRPAALADAAAAAAWARARGAAHVVVSAHSAGGLLAAALLDRGDVDGALLRAPFLDVCTPATGRGGGGENGATQAALAAHEAGEWASPGDAAGLAAACPYTRLRAAGKVAAPRPPVLISMGDRDARVTLAGAAKWVARWRATGGGGGGGGGAPAHPTLLCVRHGEGHDGPVGPEALDCMGVEAAFALAAVDGRL